MAYDSATDTGLASQAYQRALAAAAQRRTQLDTQFGLNADGTMNTSAAGQLGSIYQGNLGSVMQEHQAEVADRRRGFKGTGGLAGKATAAADRSAQATQALGLRDATSQLSGVTADEQAATQQNVDDLATIRSKSAFDLAQTLADNPIQAPEAPNYASNPALPPSAILKAATKNQNKLKNIGFNARY
jgi:hypothetical protein